MKRYKLFIISSLLVLAGCGSNDQVQDVTLMLDYTPNTNHTGIYVADSLGYYEDAGINLDIVMPSNVATESVVATGSSQFGISYGENVEMFNDSEEALTSIYGILNTNTSGFLSRAEDNITRPKDFEGKTYCGWGSDIESSLINTLVLADNGDPSKVDNIVASSNLMTEDDCDFVWSYEAWDNINLENNGVEYNYIPFTDYGVDWYTPVIITSKQLEEENPKLVEDFVSATQKGYEYAIENPEESAQILLDAAPELDSDLVNASQTHITQYYQTEGEELGYQSPELWQQFTEWMNENGIVSLETSDSLFTNDYI
ncbi:ABC transporter substrate-binding protein [Mollicutes bacterium LVI A0078]|nr:ABC transporter substrate-binding protein [Mollicutes bacterium LVI A0075]WOO91552.1 ABC transporter substrate-binding protein [Mollicutes bacterium LVI A0078]